MSSLRTRVLVAAVLAAAGGAVIAVGLAAQPAALVRGPYLQTGTPTSVIVRWRTSVASDGVVRYGTAPSQLTETAVQAGVTTEHRVVLSGLTPHTRYFYAIGSAAATLAGGDLDHSFVTAPPPGARVPTRVWVLGDSGTADDAVRRVRDGALVAMRDHEPDFWMMLGDNAYFSGTDAEYQTAVFDTFAASLRRAVLWPTFGNHDAVSADASTQSGPYFDSFSLPRAAEAGGVPSGTEAYYSFDYGNLHVICLDSSESDRSPTGPMVTWLRQDLAANTAEWTIAFFHHPPYSKGTHDSDTERELMEMRENVAPVLEAGGVDLVLAGHSHSYERSTFLNGHYGASSTFGPQFQVDAGSGGETTSGAYRKDRVPNARGTVYVVAGNAGIGGPFGGPVHPAMPITVGGWGSLVIDVDGPRLVVRLLGNGIPARVSDVATLIKHAPSGLPDAPAGAVRALAVGGRVALRWDAGGGGRPLEHVLEAGTGPGLRDVAVVGTGRVSTAFDAQAAPGRYFVRARARNAAGLGPPSPDTVVTLDASGHAVPPAPDVLTHGAFGSVVTVAYSPASGASPVDHVFEAGTAPGRRDLATIPVEFGGFTARGVPPGVYYGRIRARNPAGEGPPSREMQFVVGGVPAVPDYPLFPRAAVDGDVVTIEWPPPRLGAPVRYVVEAGLTPGATDVVLRTADATPRLVVAGVPSGVYYVRVRGENAFGSGLASDEVTVRVP